RAVGQVYRANAGVRYSGNRDGQGIAVDVSRCGDAERGVGRVFSDRDRLVGICSRGIVDRRDIDADGGDVAVGAAVLGLVAGAVGAVVVRGRRVGEGAVGVERQAAVGRTADQDRAERIPVDVAVVGEHVAADRRIFVRRRRVVLGDRGVVDRGDVDADGGD